MNKITYGMIKEEYRCDQSNRVSYGIAAYENFEEDGMATIIAMISDISSDEGKIFELVEKCNALELSLCHLNDVVEDFLAYS